MNFNITNRENQKGTTLETFGSAFTIEAKWIKLATVVGCMATVGTNWLIPIICKRVKDIKIRHENKLLMRLLQ